MVLNVNNAVYYPRAKLHPACQAPPPPGYPTSACDQLTANATDAEMKYNVDGNNVPSNHNQPYQYQQYGVADNQNHNQSVANLVASYGVYHEVANDDDGFPSTHSTHPPGYPRNYPEMVVNTSGRTSVVRNDQTERFSGTERNANNCAQEEPTGCSWCIGADGSTTPAQADNAGWLDCCKPSVLLLILVLLIVVFIMVSGALVYINYVAYRPKHSYVEEPCEKTFCAWGAQCVTGADGRAHCQCPTHCRPHVEPVCGSDGRTYDNHCQLRVASCRARVNTKINYVGKCEVRDPCKERQCSVGSHCVASPDGRNATCRCLDECPIQSATPVCGSDGVDYANECELQAAGCRNKQDVTIKYQGKCDPCLGVVCGEPEICQLDDHRNPVCRCGEVCPLEFVPVCASDGKTYSNECVLKQEGCRTRKTLNIIYHGKCSSGVNPCASVNCSVGEECAINKFGIAACECPPRCEPIVRPVCVEDGRTHASECEARRAACLARSGVAMNIIHVGVCGTTSQCTRHQCRFGASCELTDTGRPHCVCPPPCPAAFDPVCGTDGTSYGNECRMHREACLRQKDIAVLYRGPCDGCENKQCDFYAICSEVDETARCACPRMDQCNLFNGTVCGTDGATYPSECALRSAACETKQYILVAYNGDCDRCASPKDCDSDGAEPVCATDGVTYSNECELRRAACRTGAQQLEVEFYGDCGERFSVAVTVTPSVVTASGIIDNGRVSGAADSSEACRDVRCDHDATCELGPDSFPKCACRFNCTSALGMDDGPICASDLQIYASPCDMKMAACERQQELRLRPLDLCQGMEVKPCNGGKPIADSTTGIELDCGNGPLRQDCPSGSYCHQTGRFARCCRKDHRILTTSCENTWHGCCPDGKTPALGANFTGCPITCGCNKLGAYSEACDPTTLTCNCRPGVGGEKCDRCEPGYWGLPKISSGHQGCIPCGCSIAGSVREDCEQMTGRCVCKPGIQGQKCTICTGHDKVFGTTGCIPADQVAGTDWPLRRYTPVEFTQSDDANSPLSKSTRHLLVPDPRWYYERKGLNFQKGYTLHSGADYGNSSSTGLVKPTSATVRILTALLGDLCSSQEDCTISHSHCVRGACVCLDSYLESPDRQECIEGNSESLNGLDGYKIPGFDGTSYVRLKPLKAYHKLSIELEFKTYTTDGILLYTQQHADGRGDFVSLALINGFVEFRYDLGDGPVTITSLEKVVPGEYHRIVAKRYHRDGMLQVDDGENVAGQSAGKLRALDLAEDTFIGYVPTNYSRIYTNIGVEIGLQGCIRQLRLGRKDVPLWEGDEQVVRVSGVQECGASFKATTTSSKPPFGSVASLNGASFIMLSTPPGLGKQFTIEVSFNSLSPDGLIMYIGQMATAKGDFLSLGLVKGRVQFRFNLGSGIANITSINHISLNSWHKVRITRQGRDGTLQIDNQPVVRGKSGSPLLELNLGMPLYIGSMKSWKEVHPLAGLSKGFRGTISQMTINGKLHSITHKMALCTNETNTNPCAFDIGVHQGLADRSR